MPNAGSSRSTSVMMNSPVTESIGSSHLPSPRGEVPSGFVVVGTPWVDGACPPGTVDCNTIATLLASRPTNGPDTLAIRSAYIPSTGAVHAELAASLTGCPVSGGTIWFEAACALASPWSRLVSWTKTGWGFAGSEPHGVKILRPEGQMTFPSMLSHPAAASREAA